jgi:riboflavin kinase / FMN adenylyltransferase
VTGGKVERVLLFTDLDQVPADFGPSVVTIGNFDGVHRGHQRVLGRMVADAKEAGHHAVAVTFDPHPLQVHRPEAALPLITGLTDRLELLARTGLDATLVLRYTLEFARQTPEEFVLRTFVEGLRAATVVVGRDVRFGRDNAGDLSTMIDLGKEYGFVVEVIDDASEAVETEGAGPELGRRWSSTWVRDLLTAGDVAAAAAILGRPHRMRGVVVHGDARGRDLGFPTANLAHDADGLVPADGVYAGRLLRRPSTGDEVALPAAISVGTNPTFDGLIRRVEAYVLDHDDRWDELNLYDEEVVFEFVERLRPTLRFQSVDELIAQMAADVDAARNILRR